MRIRQNTLLPYLQDVWLINLSLEEGLKNFIWKVLFSGSTCLFTFFWNISKFRMNITQIYIWSMNLIVLWIRILMNFEKEKSFKEYLLPNRWVRIFNINGKHLFSNTPTFALIVLVLQVTIVKEWKTWYSCFSQLCQGSFHCYHWHYHYHATNQISCKTTSSSCLKYSSKINWQCEHMIILYKYHEKKSLSCWHPCWKNE